MSPVGNSLPLDRFYYLNNFQAVISLLLERDLVQLWPTEQCYRMIGVEGPGDRLQDNQRRLLELWASHQMPVRDAGRWAVR